ncbi:hypothetical protein QQF64_009557 [Cirrhinus molitorella]|uniref:Integrase catalytic domain-containing protein n=1 Tax=Cirrhinus molitorella TaxID=172907 RepID=A0ABR3M1H9_9TELE
MSSQLFDRLQTEAKRQNQTLKYQRCVLNVQSYSQNEVQLEQVAPIHLTIGPMSVVHPVYISPMDSYPLLIGKDLLDRFEALLDFKQLKISSARTSASSVPEITRHRLPAKDLGSDSPQVRADLQLNDVTTTDIILALWADNSAISLTLFDTLKRHTPNIPIANKRTRFSLDPCLSTLVTAKSICALNLKWNNRCLTHYFLILPDLPHDVYIRADILIRLRAHVPHGLAACQSCSGDMPMVVAEEPLPQPLTCHRYFEESVCQGMPTAYVDGCSYNHDGILKAGAGVLWLNDQPCPPQHFSSNQQIQTTEPRCSAEESHSLGPLPRSMRGNKYFLTVVCQFTKWVWTTPESQLRQRHPLHSRDHAADLGNSGNPCTAAHKPVSSGQVERSNQSVVNMLRKYVSANQKDWDVKLPLVLMAIRATPQESTGVSPFELMTGRQITLPLHLLYQPGDSNLVTAYTTHQYLNELHQHLRTTFAFAQQRLQKSAEGQKTYYDWKASHKELEVGDKIWYYRHLKQPRNGFQRNFCHAGQDLTRLLTNSPLLHIGSS